jgi:hypothetical protein
MILRERLFKDIDAGLGTLAGDANFMPVIGDTKVVSQSLEALYDLIVGEF